MASGVCLVSGLVHTYNTITIVATGRLTGLPNSFVFVIPVAKTDDDDEWRSQAMPADDKQREID